MDEAAKGALLALERSVVGALRDFDEELSDAVLYALGPRPESLGPHGDELRLREALARVCYPARWLEDYPREGLVYFYRALHQLVRDRGGTPQAAEHIRGDLQEGKLRAVLLLENGEHLDIAPHRWRKSDQLWWSATEEVKSPSGELMRGDVYIIMPTLGLKTKPDELSGRERSTARKLVLGMAMVGYGYRPGRRSDVIPTIERDLEQVGLDVSEDTIRNWLKEASEEVYDASRDQMTKPN